MTAPRKPGFLLPVSITLAVLLGLYVGAYYAMVRPTQFDLDVQGFPMHPPLEPVYAGSGPTYEGWQYKVFAPIHWLDRRIRPHVWEPK